MIVGGLLPLAAMLVSLFAAVWIRDPGRGHEREALASRSHSY